jgi:LuxR family transcriptional regulator, maltose regulon positive regulatory protein
LILIIASRFILHYNDCIMSFTDLIIQSQLYPPRPRKNLLHRPRLEERIKAALDGPLTIVQAGTGYGKSTALASFLGEDYQAFWYTITEPDRDPLLFLIHLLSAFGEYGQTAIHSLEINDGLITPATLHPLLNFLTKHLKVDAILVLDDFHLVSHVEEILDLFKKLVDYCPPRLHIVLSTRHMPDSPDFNRWRVKGLISVIGVSELTFSVDEIEILFRDQYKYPITTAQAEVLAIETEGWAIALQMIWQGLQSGIIPNLETALQKLPATLDRLFDYLAPEVLARQPAHIQRFLLTTSVLRQLNGPACDALLETQDSKSLLHHLFDIGLFVDFVGEDTYRYQRLFHDFLINQVGKIPEKQVSLHRRAASYFEKIGHPEETLYHLLEAQEFTRAAELIEKIGGGLLASGRLDSMSDWLNRLPKEYCKDRPELEFLFGEVCRLHALFEDALTYYEMAARLYHQNNDPLGQSRSLRGQAQVYLDTVRPLQAAALLADALDLLDPVIHRRETADLLEQLAENKLNFGFPDQARELHQESLRLRSETRPTDIYLDARILLRTGKLTEARRLLESYELDEPIFGQVRQQHFHREKQLLLSLLCVLQGNQKDAEQYARQGIAIGQKMQSDFVEAVGYMRLGHALQLDSYNPWGESQHQSAIDCYLDVIEKVRPFKVARVSLEPLWGLCRAYGYEGDIEAAEENARRSIEISRSAGDEWIGHLVRVNMGAILAMDGREKAATRWLNEAAEGLDRVQDTFGWATAQLWLALNAWWQGEEETALRHLSALLPVVSENGYDFLFTKRTHLGLRDDQAAIPLLLDAYQQNIEREFTLKLLMQAGKFGLEYHPGYTLWVRTLGPFCIWRGDKQVNPQEWKRERARQLFQLLITTRGQWLSREQIVDLLWPDLPADSAIRDFKVALNAVNRTLEPKRIPSVSAYFVIRQGNAYGINPQAQLVTDADVFLTLALSDDSGKLEAALKLYGDDYLPDCIYSDWASIARENYRQKYLAVTEHLANLHFQAQRWDDVLIVCQAALRRDKCWEPAYVLSMQAYASQGNIPQAQATYQRCEMVLREELGLEPSIKTQRLRQLITKGY